MSYEKQIFSKGQVLKADDLNKMSEGIVSKCEIIDAGEAYVKGDTIPNSGVVEKVYINTQLSAKEWFTLIKNVLTTPIPFNGESIVLWDESMPYCVLANESGTSFLQIVPYISSDTYESVACGLTIDDSIVFELVVVHTYDGDVYEFALDTPLTEYTVNITASSNYMGQPLPITGIFNEMLSSLFAITPFSEYRMATIESAGVRIYPKTQVSQVEGLSNELNKKQDLINVRDGNGLVLENNMLKSSVVVSGENVNHDWSNYDSGLFNNICDYLKQGLTVYVSAFNNGDRMRLPIVQINGGYDWYYFDSVSSFTIQEIKDGKIYLYTWDYEGVTTQVFNQNSIIDVESLPIEDIDKNSIYRKPNNKLFYPITTYKNNYQGTTVPNNTNIGKVYFNNELSYDEVNSLLDKLTYVQTPFVELPLCPLLFANDGNPVIFAIKQNKGYEITIATDIANQVFEYVYTYGYSDVEDGFKISEYTIDKLVIDNYSGLTIGSENELISNLFSTTPFIKSTEEIINFVELKTTQNENHLYAHHIRVYGECTVPAGMTYNFDCRIDVYLNNRYIESMYGEDTDNLKPLLAEDENGLLTNTNILASGTIRTSEVVEQIKSITIAPDGKLSLETNLFAGYETSTYRISEVVRQIF